MESRYELLRPLAAGGMGEVFIARRVGAGDFEKRVALKLLLPHLVADQDLISRFYAEARLAAQMHHPNIVEIFDVGEADGRPFIAMQLVDGLSVNTLIKHLRVAGPLPLPMFRLIATGVCEALRYAHGLVDRQGQALKVVHRDVTPSNILLSRAGQVLLTDFGIAHIEAQVTRAGAIRGKMGYLAPEQVLHDAPLDSRTDQFGLAITLYELLTGYNPWRQPTLSDSMKALLEVPLPPVTQVRPDVTPRLAAALLKGVARHPAQRFADLAEFEAELLDGPVATAPELGRWLQENAGPLLSRPEVNPPREGTRSINTRTLLSPADRHATPHTQSVSLEKPPRSLTPWLVLAAFIGISLLAGFGAVSEAVDEQRDHAAEAAQERLELDAGPPVELAAPEPDAGTPEVAVAPPVVADAGAVTPEHHAVTHVHTPLTARPPPVETKKGLEVGYLTADAVPWAEVSVDGRVLDRTPFARFPLPAGPHEVTFKGPDGRLQKRSVKLVSGETAAVKVDFNE